MMMTFVLRKKDVPQPLKREKNGRMFVIVDL